MTDSLIEPPKVDGFKTESPLRAFTNWNPEGLYAVGKGFRPSVQHLARYLNAIETREGWRLIQILHGEDRANMTMLFYNIRTLAPSDKPKWNTCAGLGRGLEP